LIVLKYNTIASYTKILSAIFKPILDEHYTDFLLQKRFRTKDSLHGLSEIKNIHKQYDDSKLYYVAPFLSVNEEFVPSPIETFNTQMKGIKYTVLFPLVPYEERIYSITHRESLGKFKSSKDITEAMVNAIAHYCGVNEIENDDVKSHQNVDNILMMKDFERLVELHNKGELYLVILTKDTILNDTVKILEHLGIQYDGDLKDIISKVPRQGREDVHSSKIFKETMEQYGEALEKRYQDINLLIKENNITVL